MLWAEIVNPPTFPRPLSAYTDAPQDALFSTFASRVRAEPFNAVATLIFFLAIVHTFLAPRFLRKAHEFEHALQSADSQAQAQSQGIRFKAEVFHLLGEVEAVFGIWIIPLIIAIVLSKGWITAREYISHTTTFVEPIFVVVIMTIAASRPILEIAERLMSLGAALGKCSSAAWWFAILTIGPVLGSFITEPAAMTISALLLASRFYQHHPSSKFAYATLGLLFVNVSVGGTLTHFAAPPVLMVAGKWSWGVGHMFVHFGWKAIAGLLTANLVYFFIFRREFKLITTAQGAKPPNPNALKESTPVWVTAVHILALIWTVFNNHYPVLFVGGFLFYLAFTQATGYFQNELNLRPALLVGFFLAGLVVHGGLQGWWIAPVLSKLSEIPLYFGATLLTAFNDNAAITYLASLVPGFSPPLKYAVVAGAVVGGGLTVIANAPNPAGQSILSRFFPDGVSPFYLFLGSLPATVIVGTFFLLFR
jgi:hypothetical protein